MSKPEISPGLAFIQAAANAIPRTMGDRVEIGLLTELLATAIKNKFIFHLEDAQALNRLAIRTNVGIFRPMDEYFYRIACRHGGTYPKLWEKAHNTKPWMAPKVAIYGYPAYQPQILENNRVVPGMAVLVQSREESLPESSIYQGLQVWWCTSISATQINMALYPTHPSNPFKSEGKLLKLKKLSREEWAKWVAHESETQTQ